MYNSVDAGWSHAIINFTPLSPLHKHHRVHQKPTHKGGISEEIGGEVTFFIATPDNC